jgi:SAM-dependent methyltransferase
VDSPGRGRRGRESVHATNLTWHELDGFTLRGFADSSVDFVFSHDVFVHFSSLQVLPYLREIWRVLRPGGLGLISFYDFSNSVDLFDSLSMDFWAQRRFPPHMRIHFLTEEMLRSLLDRTGFEILDLDRTNFLIGAFRKP